MVFGVSIGQLLLDTLLGCLALSAGMFFILMFLPVALKDKVPMWMGYIAWVTPILILIAWGLLVTVVYLLTVSQPPAPAAPQERGSPA